MSRVGRVELRIEKDGDEVELLEVNVFPYRGWRGDAMITECLSDEQVADLVAGRTDGIHDVRGEYHEEFHQDYYGEWDGHFYLENVRYRYCGPCRPSVKESREK